MPPSSTVVLFSVYGRVATVVVTTGALATVIVTVSVSLRVPPLPVLPRSLVTILRLAAPVKLVVGLKLRPARAALMLPMVPVNIIVASAVPSPALKVRPAMPDSVVTPLVLTSWTCTEFVAASRSLIEMRLLFADENTSATFLAVVCVAGTPLTGPSLTAATAIVRLEVLLSRMPSLTMNVTVRTDTFGAWLLSL